MSDPPPWAGAQRSRRGLSPLFSERSTDDGGCAPCASLHTPTRQGPTFQVVAAALTGTARENPIRARCRAGPTASLTRLHQPHRPPTIYPESARSLSSANTTTVTPRITRRRCPENRAKSHTSRSRVWGPTSLNFSGKPEPNSSLSSPPARSRTRIKRTCSGTLCLRGTLVDHNRPQFPKSASCLAIKNYVYCAFAWDRPEGVSSSRYKRPKFTPGLAPGGRRQPPLLLRRHAVTICPGPPRRAGLDSWSPVATLDYSWTRWPCRSVHGTPRGSI